MMKKRIFSNIGSNIGLKILSVALAVSLWFFVTYRGQSEMAIDVPIEFKNMPNGLEILRQNIKTVSLNIRGHERLLKGLNPMDVRVIVDMTDAKKGDSIYYFDKDNIAIPRTMQVLRIEPVSVKVAIDELVKKTVLVKAHIIGMAELGFKVKSVAVDPSSTEIEGAKTEIGRIAVLRTDPIDITGLDTDIIQTVKVNLSGRNVRTKTTEVTVKISIERAKK